MMAAAVPGCRGGIGHGRPALPGYLRHDLLGVGAGTQTEVVDEHTGSFVSEEEGVLALDPSTGSGHDRYLAIKSSQDHPPDFFRWFWMITFAALDRAHAC